MKSGCSTEALQGTWGICCQASHLGSFYLWCLQWLPLLQLLHSLPVTIQQFCCIGCQSFSHFWGPHRCHISWRRQLWRSCWCLGQKHPIQGSKKGRRLGLRWLLGPMTLHASCLLVSKAQVMFLWRRHFCIISSPFQLPSRLVNMVFICCTCMISNHAFPKYLILHTSLLFFSTVEVLLKSSKLSELNFFYFFFPPPFFLGPFAVNIDIFVVARMFQLMDRL